MTTQEKLTAIAENEQRVYEAGKARRDYEWWENYYTQEWFGTKRKRANWVYAFAGVGWHDGNYNPIREIVVYNTDTGMDASACNTQMIYSLSAITDTKVPIDISTPKRVINVTSTFINAANLETIRELRVNEYTYMHRQVNSANTKLRNITIVGQIGGNPDGVDVDVDFQWCPLTPSSMKSIILALADMSEMSQAYTLTVNFNEDCWTDLEADSTAPDGGTWRDYVQSLGWNT